MSNMNETKNIKKQYSDDENLSIRINLHAKHSTNKQRFIPWLFDKYEFSENYHILELGCGNGRQWEGRIENLPKGCNLILSDFSDGMVNIVRSKFSIYKALSFENIDIQSIPYHDETFDVVIANHMLYHIPDLSSALLEVKRVLKTGGKLYSTTNGNGGMRLFIHNVLEHFCGDINAFTQEWSFSLQNGTEILKSYFSDVKRYDYEDCLSITKTQDLVDWIESTISISNYSEKSIDGLFDYLEEIRKRDGRIYIQKENGLFISLK